MGSSLFAFNKLWKTKLEQFLVLHHFPIKNIALFASAFTHSSYSKKHQDIMSAMCRRGIEDHSSYSKKHEEITDYEKLELFGDALIGFVVTEFLYAENHKKSTPLGTLCRRKHFLVSEKVLSQVATNLKLTDLILHNLSSPQSLKKGILSDVFEALIGVIYLETGIENTKQFLLKWLLKPFYPKSLTRIDYSTILQELNQKIDKTVPHYHFHKEGEEFIAECHCQNQITVAKAKSKKMARTEAAHLMLHKLNEK